MLKANYHTHTKRCGHASGEDGDYVLEALGMGFTELGFSDHIMLPGFKEENVRGDYSLSADYFESIGRLKIKYADRMRIDLGFEAESFPLYFPYYKELLEAGTIDYLILGNHCQMNEERKIINYFAKITSSAELYLYRDLALSALQTGLFSCFAHPDYFMSSIQNPDKDVKKVMEDLIAVCLDLDIPLEVNAAGIRNGLKRLGSDLRYVYPTDEFFSLAGKMGAKCIIGLDAHAPDQISNEDSMDKAIMFARKHNLKLIDRLPFKRGF
ncbi:MAG: histidinol-phosphatase [Bacilli bacterium]|jgi:histidinol-phosphatase (PHP family)|nr:histidinol-phosphatase [Bacilli bacterium]